MFKLQKQPVYDIKKLENTTVLSLRDRGQPIHMQKVALAVVVLSLRDRGQPPKEKTRSDRKQFFPCVTGVNLTVPESAHTEKDLSLRDRGQPRSG